MVLLVCKGDDNKEITALIRVNPEPETHRKEGQQQGVTYVGLFSYACPELRNSFARVLPNCEMKCYVIGIHISWFEPKSSKSVLPFVTRLG